MSDRLSEAALHVAATRPALLLGLPLELATVHGVLLGIAGVLKLYLVPIPIVLWYGCTILVRRDYNAVGVFFLWMRSSGNAMDADIWHGASLATFPMRAARRFRGIIDHAG